MRMLESTRAGSGWASPWHLASPCQAQDLPDFRDRQVNRWFSTQATKPGTWFFYKAIVLPLRKKWRLRRETSNSNSLGAISQAYFSYFLKSPLPASHPSSGRVRDALFRVWRALGGMWAASEWPRLGGQRSPSLPHVGLRNSGGPGEAWKTELHHQPSFERWLEERGEGPPSGLSPTPPAPSTSAIRLHRPRKHSERSSELSSSSQAGRKHLEGGSFPPPARI